MLSSYHFFCLFKLHTNYSVCIFLSSLSTLFPAEKIEERLPDLLNRALAGVAFVTYINVSVLYTAHACMTK